MSGLEQVKAAIAKALEQAGTAARAAVAPGWARSYEEPEVAVGLRMGARPAGCDSALETLHQVMLGSLPSGLRPTELKWEETGWDEDTAMFLRRGSLSCSAFFTALAEEDGALISDFILKGVVTKG